MLTLKQRTIKKRLLWSMILISIIPILALSIFTYVYLSRNLEREYVSNNESKISWANQYLDTVIEQLHDTVYALRINQTLMASIDFQDADELQKKQYIIDTLNQTLYANSNLINEIILYDHESQSMSVLNYRSGGSFFIRHIDNTVFTPIEETPTGLRFVTYQNQIYVLHSINKFEDQSFLGGIALKVDQQVFSTLDEILTSEEGTYFVLTENNQYVMGLENESLDTFLVESRALIQPNNIMFKTYESDLYWVTDTSSKELTIVQTIPVEVFNEAFNPIAWITVAIGLMALGISVFISYVISKRISDPISRIIKKMQQAPLDEIRLSLDQYDEIVELEKGYNEMTDAIKKLIIEKYKKNLELKTAQLKALQSQMNPHFLNNTFQLIGGMALSLKAPEIYDITSSMGEMMKYILTKDEDLLTLKDEINHTKHYLSIQKERFSHMVEVDLKFDASLESYMIPKFTLQPLVENSFKHGFTKKDKTWHIHISVLKDENLMITVEDNGMGMTDEKADLINQHLANHDLHDQDLYTTNSTGIGLSNIHERIQLIFGKAYGLKVEAKKEGGTKVILHMPAIQKGEYHV